MNSKKYIPCRVEKKAALKVQGVPAGKELNFNRKIISFF
jgi:hypothetical protein